MSDSVGPHRRQPTRLPCPWDSPGKNTGVGCHFLLQCMKVKTESEVTQLCPTLSDPMDCSLPGSSFHGIFQARVLEWGAIAFSIPSSAAATDAKSLQSCPTLPVHCSAWTLSAGKPLKRPLLSESPVGGEFRGSLFPGVASSTYDSTLSIVVSAWLGICLGVEM